MKGTRSKAGVFIETSETLTHDRVARAIGCARPQLTKYLNGVRPISSMMRTKLEREFGTDGVTLINLCSEAHRAKDEGTRANAGIKKQTAKRTRTKNHLPQPYDGPWFTISEWRAKFGEPGCSSRSDPHGRVEGFFPTEPCFLGE
jgi:plasmid maintenance system antidote protein VapI